MSLLFFSHFFLFSTCLWSLSFFLPFQVTLFGTFNKTMGNIFTLHFLRQYFLSLEKRQYFCRLYSFSLFTKTQTHVPVSARELVHLLTLQK